MGTSKVSVFSNVTSGALKPSKTEKSLFCSHECL